MEDEWIFNKTNTNDGSPLKKATSSTVNYEDACTEESISYFL